MRANASDNPDPRTCFNGIDISTGDYFFPPMPAEELARWGAAELSGVDRRQLERARRRTSLHGMAPREGVDPRRLDEAGWGVIFAADAEPELRRALEPLLALRREQAGRLYCEYGGRDGLAPGESKQHFLSRHGVAPGPADPERVPYYLLLVGDPEAIPFSFQYQLAMQYAVGRLCFERPEEYRAYAAGVVAAEQSRPRPRRAAFFGVRQAGDRATELTHDQLVTPLSQGLSTAGGGWSIERIGDGSATKERLTSLLGGDDTPALLLTGGHGLCAALGHPQQRSYQGALVCQKETAEGDGIADFVFAGDDIDRGAPPDGLVLLSVACFSAGTPQRNGFRHRPEEPLAAAERAFVARLPQRLLSHPEGGALAMIGHVDRAWTYSFAWPGAGRQLQTFDSVLRRLLAGYPVGAAMEYFGQRYAELACDLAEMGLELAFGGQPSIDLAGMWTARNDARSWVILGDPAVRLAVPEASPTGDLMGTGAMPSSGEPV